MLDLGVGTTLSIIVKIDKTNTFGRSGQMRAGERVSSSMGELGNLGVCSNVVHRRNATNETSMVLRILKFADA